MSLELKPLGYRVVLQTDGVIEKTDGGIYLPTDLSERESHGQNEGTIIAIGPDAFDKGFKPEVGARVFFARYAGDVWEDEEANKFRIVNDEDIVGIIGEKE